MHGDLCRLAQLGAQGFFQNWVLVLPRDWRVLRGQAACHVGLQAVLLDPSTGMLSATSVLAVFLQVAVWEKMRNCFTA